MHTSTRTHTHAHSRVFGVHSPSSRTQAHLPKEALGGGGRKEMWEWQAPPTSHRPGELCRQGQIPELNPMTHTSREYGHTAEGGPGLRGAGRASFQDTSLPRRSATEAQVCSAWWLSSHDGQAGYVRGERRPALPGVEVARRSQHARAPFRSPT